MSIFDETGQGTSVTEGHRALALFTNRHFYLRKFATYLNEAPPPGKILFVHGDGGNGKSLLLRFLVEKCCKEFAPDDWAYLNDLEDEDFASQLREADVAFVPYVLHDFAMQPNLDERPQEPFEGPFMLRRALANRGLLFPLFDFRVRMAFAQDGPAKCEFYSGPLSVRRGGRHHRPRKRHPERAGPQPRLCSAGAFD